VDRLYHVLAGPRAPLDPRRAPRRRLHRDRGPAGALRPGAVRAPRAPRHAAPGLDPPRRRRPIVRGRATGRAAPPRDHR